MPTLYLLTPGTSATLQGERAHIELPPDPDDAAAAREVRDVRLVDIEQVVTTEHVAMTMPLLGAFLRREIPVLLTSRGEKMIGLCLPPAQLSLCRLAQYRRSEDRNFQLALAVNWVEAKILNSRRMLQRLAANREGAAVHETIAVLDTLADKCRGAGSLDTLRGFEGTSAGRYFEALATFFPRDCPFERRSRRPPHNAANAVLSYAYTLLTAEAECRLHAVGLDPAIGFLHEPADRRPSLALDVVEPFRAPVADALALDLLGHDTLKPAVHFQTRDGGVYLNAEGRKRFLIAYERRLTREFLSEQTGQRTSIRGLLHRQAQAVKQAILNDEPFEPFLMN
jgi:CRISPR-associated protein Cas1